MYVKGSLFPEGIKEGMEFDFHDLSSWSREQNVAMNFSTTSPDGKREAGDKSVIFTMTMKRGTYIDYYSAYDGEEEVITGGKVKIVEVTKMEKMQGTILRVLCEQI
jgi:glucose/arabinose dehydrogenase